MTLSLDEICYTHLEGQEQDIKLFIQYESANLVISAESCSSKLDISSHTQDFQKAGKL